MTASDPRDRYRIESLLGKGGMGEVYKAFDPVLDRTVALKTISSISEDPLLLQRLYIEARACGRLAHPNIVRVYDLHESTSAVYISMEYLEGESLAAAMERGTLPLAHKLQILDEILSALHYAHTHNVIHRDVKPSNVHLAPDGHIKLLDFGLARMTVGPTMTMAGAVMGTAPYMSPEQLKAQVVDARTDIYSTGVLAYELLTGHRAFEGENITAVMLKVLSEFPAPIETARLGVPPEIAHVVNRAMAKSPDDRYSSAGEMRTALAECSPRIVPASDRWSVTSAPTQADATRLIPNREQAPVAANETRLSPTASDPIGGLLNAPPPPAETRMAPKAAAATEPSLSERILSMLGPRATSVIGVAVLLIAFSLVWAITQLFLSPGTSASDAPPKTDVPTATTDGISRPRPSDKVAVDNVPPPALDPPVIEPPRSDPSVARSGDGAGSPRGSGQGSVTAANSSTSQNTSTTQLPVTTQTQTTGQQTQGQTTPGQTTQARTQTVSAAANNDLSRTFAERLRESLRQTGYSGRDSLAVSLEMSTRPSGFSTGGITGDYVASVRTAGGTQRVEGHVLRFDEVTLRSAVLDEAVEKIVAALSAAAPAR